MAKTATGGDFTLEKSLPSNVEAERSILGAILLDNTTINQAAERLKRDDFFLESHRRIYDRMLYLMEQGRAIDPIMLQEELRRMGDLEIVGGPAYISQLYDEISITQHTRSRSNIGVLFCLCEGERDPRGAARSCRAHDFGHRRRPHSPG